MSRFLSPTLAAVTPYTPGEQPQDQQYIKLNTNESPYLPSPAVIAAVSEHEVEKLRLYSDPACADLLKAAAAHFGLQPEQIMPGNGSDENLFFALRAFCDADHPLAYADITYGCYGVWCGLMHIPSHIIPLKEDFTLDPKDYYGLNQTIVLANPNAPTGIALPRAEIEGILKANPNNVVIVDEAYVDFGGESCVPLIDRYENLLVVQTFSKSRQLAGARLGLAMGNAKLIADLNRVKFSLNPYNINRLTLKAGQAALEDTAYFDRTRAAIVDTRAWTKQQLEQRGFAVLDSRSNFLFASTDRKDGETLYKKLKKNGILVRHFDAPRIQNWLRITIGTPEQMQTFMETLDKINNLPLNPMLEAATGSLHQSQATMQRLQTTLDNINKITANQSMQQLPQDMQKTLRELNRSMQGFQPGSAAYNKMVADMQRLDQVLRELQPVLKTLNEKSNALVFEAKDKKDPEPKRAKQ